MPLIALVLLNIVVGLLLAESAARELRASPRSVMALRGFAAVAMHETLVVTPCLFWLLERQPDWMVSYLFDGAKIPSALALFLGLVDGALGLAGFAVGARWFREHHPRRIRVAAGAIVAAAALGLLVARERVGVVGSYLQFRGGFGLAPWLGSSASAAVLVALFASGAGAGALVVWLRRER